MTTLRRLQIAGTLGIVAAYISFVLKYAWVGWAILAIVGLIELVVIFGYKNTITRFWRNLTGKIVDKIILFALIVVTWALAGELAAGFFLLGLLNSHFHEHE